MSLFALFAAPFAFASGEAGFSGYLRYAEPPVGTLRWEAPVPARRPLPESAAVACPQEPNLRDAGVTLREDCLRIAVWSPPGKGHPVLVYFHGGGLASGGGFLPPVQPRRFTGRGIVFVSFNYRLGAFGFLPWADRPESPGMLDQELALRWVHEHVSEYGGDPGNLTLLGHSMGGWSIRNLLNLGRVPPGVRKVILLSAGTNVDLEPRRLPVATREAYRHRPWEETWAALSRERLSLQPLALFAPERWRGISLLQTVIHREDEQDGVPSANFSYEKRLCLARKFEAVTAPGGGALVEVLHAGASSHGSELAALFGEGSFGNRFLDEITAFVARGRGVVPAWLAGFDLHLFSWARLPWLPTAACEVP